MKRGQVLGTAVAMVVGGVAIALWGRKREVVPVSIVKPEIDPAIAIRRERPVIIPPPAQPPRQNAFSEILNSGVDLKFPPEGPTEDPAFGLDSIRNEDTDVALDDYMNLPLEGAGLTHRNRHAYRDAEDAGTEAAPRVMRFQFFRFKVIRTRDPAAATAAIGGLMLMNGADNIYHPEAKVWNPHTGARETFYPAAGWSDSDQKEFVVKFPSAVAVNRYRLRTSEQDTAFDPVEWRLEGSQNGVYWLPLDERKTEGLPSTRGAWVHFSMRLVA